MKKTVLTFGFLSGGVAALMMFATIPFTERIGFDKSMAVGYTSMVIAFMFVFFGVRSYRDNVLGGRIAFGRAFGVGLLITLISCLCYVVAWQILYYNFMPDFMDKYGAYMIESMKARGAAAAEIVATEQQMAEFKVMYANPLINAAFTLMEPLPVGLLFTTVSAIVLRKK